MSKNQPTIPLAWPITNAFGMAISQLLSARGKGVRVTPPRGEGRGVGGVTDVRASLIQYDGLGQNCAEGNTQNPKLT